ncbi:MAG: NAD-dependent epimerase/dehydratase family protein [Gemmatimonadota bacterium]|nr:NAD-dependent epimerase/dehydratase family protein [Gemmatimonadota bacterium]
MNILVTGAAGFIGSHLAERLAALGHSVVGLDCLTPYYSRSLKELNVAAIRQAGVTFLPRDLAAGDLSAAVRDVEVVYHLAAQPGLSAGSGFELYLRNNVVATQRLLEAVQEAPSLRGFIYGSTSSVYGADATGAEDAEPRPTSHYGVTKLAAEQLVLARARDRGFPACSVRLFSVYGPRERPEKLYPRLIRSLLDDLPFPLFQGSEHHLRSYTYVGDAVDGLVSVLDNLDGAMGEIFNLGNDAAITTGEGIRLVEEIVGRRARIVREPRRAGDQTKTHADIRKARRILGYEPRTPPREGLAREVEWYREHVFGKIRP